MQRPLVFHALILSLVGAGACRPAEQPQTESTAAPAQSLHEAFDQTAEVWNRGDIAAIGTGLAHRLDRFVVSIAAEQARLLMIDGDQVSAAGWSMRAIDVGDGYEGALAVMWPDISLEVLDWPRA